MILALFLVVAVAVSRPILLTVATIYPLEPLSVMETKATSTEATETRATTSEATENEDYDPAYLDIPWPTKPDVEHQVVERSQRLTVYKMLADMNEDTPIGRLPDAVLGLIFQFHIGWGSECLVEGRTRNSHKWVAISQVCVRWRQLVLASPDFFTSIYLPWHPKAIKAAIVRSGDLPLFATLNSTRSTTHLRQRDRVATRSLLKNLHRFALIQILSWPSQALVQDQLLSKLEAAAAATSLQYYSAMNEREIPFYQPLKRASMLQCLILNYAPESLWKHCRAWPQLRKLSLFDVDPKAEMCVILEGLRTLPMLEDLELSCNFSRTWPMDPDYVIIMALNTISLQKNFENAGYLLTHMRLSPFTRLEVYNCGPEASLTTLSQSLDNYSLVLSTFISGSALPITVLEFGWEIQGGFLVLIGWIPDYLNTTAKPGMPPVFNWAFRIHLPAWGLSIKALIPRLPLTTVTGVRAMNIGATNSDISTAIVSLLRDSCLRNVASLEVMDNSMAWFDRVLHFNAFDGRATCPMPMLHSLKLYQTSEVDWCTNMMYFPTCTGCIHVLTEALRLRKWAGKPLRNLQFFDARYAHIAQRDMYALYDKVVPIS